MSASSVSSTAWNSLGLREPLVSAPMAGVSGSALALAVRSAGALGLVAVGHGAGPEYIARELGAVDAALRTNPGAVAGPSASPPGSPSAAAKPGSWGVGLMSWSLELEDQASLRQVLEYSPPVVALSAGDPTVPARLAHAAGCVVAVQVGTPAEVRAAMESPDIDIVVIRGAEGGGHGLNAVATLPLLQYALAQAAPRRGAAQLPSPRRSTEGPSAEEPHDSQRLVAPDRPSSSAPRSPIQNDSPTLTGPAPKAILAAGGIATAQGVAAVLGAGADGAWIGTRFIPCAESLSASGLQRSVVAAGLDDTVYTSVFDLALDLPWPPEYGGRALRNAVASEWAPREPALRAALSAAPEPEQRGVMLDAALALRARVLAGRAAGDPESAPVYAGQSAGLLPATALGQAAADVVAELSQFRSVLRSAASRF